MMSRYIILVGLGGFLGSISRFLTNLLFDKIWPSTIPLGTFTANVLGCLLIGLIYGFSEQIGYISAEWRLFLMTGFCGGYTTFSSFSLENVNLLQSGEYGTFTLYVVLSIMTGLLAVFGGIVLTKL